MSGEFSVCQFFPNGAREYVRRYVSAEEAWKAVSHYTNNVAVMLGMVDRVIVTDGDDCIVFEWINGFGVTFPTEDEPS